MKDTKEKRGIPKITYGIPLFFDRNTVLPNEKRDLQDAQKRIWKRTDQYRRECFLAYGCP